MRVLVAERDLARRLRHRGYSHSEIAKVVPVGKSTLTGWLKDIELTRRQKDRILLRIRDAGRRGSLKGAWQNRRKSLKRIREIVQKARRELPDRINDHLFLTGLVLFWGEGTKRTRHFIFMNSDPNAIRTMIDWLTKCGGIPKCKIVVRIHLHQIYAGKRVNDFWLNATKLPPFQFRRPVVIASAHSVKKNPAYLGCCRLVVYSSELYWKLKGWQEGLLSYLRTRVPQSRDNAVSSC